MFNRLLVALVLTSCSSSSTTNFAADPADSGRPSTILDTAGGSSLIALATGGSMATGGNSAQVTGGSPSTGGRGSGATTGGATVFLDTATHSATGTSTGTSISTGGASAVCTAAMQGQRGCSCLDPLRVGTGNPLCATGLTCETVTARCCDNGDCTIGAVGTGGASGSGGAGTTGGSSSGGSYTRPTGMNCAVIGASPGIVSASMSCDVLENPSMTSDPCVPMINLTFTGCYTRNTDTFSGRTICSALCK